MFYILIAVVPCHCVPVLNLILVPVKEHLHGITLGMKDSLNGALTFRKRNPQRLLMGIADRKAEPIWSLADNNKRLFMQYKYL